jgi:hypothetical protein
MLVFLEASGSEKKPHGASSGRYLRVGAWLVGQFGRSVGGVFSELYDLAEWAPYREVPTG